MFDTHYTKKGRHDIQHNDFQHNDIQHNGIQHNDILHKDIQHNDTQQNGRVTLAVFHLYQVSIMLSVEKSQLCRLSLC